MSLPLVAIVGAPNVGKSTLFNRLVGRRKAIVTNEPGMTRDRLYAEVTDAVRPFRVVDTGGLTPGEQAPFVDEIRRQAEAALAEAAVILFVVDARAGATALDLELAGWLRRRGEPPLLVANKVESDRVEQQALELHELGLGAAVPISAEHGLGIDVLLEQVDARLDGEGEGDGAEAAGAPELSLAIVGRPNVGKSTLMNRLLGEERVMVSEVPGTTRDAIDTVLELGPRRYRLIDTAGIRRPGRIDRVAERYSVLRAKENVERCDVVVLVLDGTEPISAQDTHIAGMIRDAYKPMLVAVNKWDRVEQREDRAKQWQDQIAYRLRFVKEVPVLFISALSGQRVTRILEAADEAHAAAGIRVSTSALNQWLQGLIAGSRSAPPPRGSLRLFYATQVGTHPPRFLLFCNDPGKAHFSVRRQLANGLRERFGFGPAPIRLAFRARRHAAEGR